MQPSNENKRGGNSKTFKKKKTITHMKSYLYNNLNNVECTKLTYRLGECKVSENIPLIDGIARYNPAF